MHILCPHCKNPVEVLDLAAAVEVTCTACGSSFRIADSSTAAWTPPAGQTLDRFQILEMVGHGAFGTVFKARDPKLDRVVALKVPRRDNVGALPQDRDRFLREARSAAQLRHPSIVSVHEVGVADDATYLVSDFVEGVTLADRLTAGRPAPREAAALIAAVAEALDYANAQGVVHRDIKPSNIMVRLDGTPVVMDFGLAKRDAGEITMTLEGQVLGTPAYMSPEQARGEAHRVDGRSDVYSLGVILYQLLTGELPFRGNTRMLLHQVLHDEPRPPRLLNDRLPRDLETICLKALAKEPGRRYPTAGALAADLRRFLAGEAIRARPVGRLERGWRWLKRKPMTAAAAALAVLAAAGLAAAAVALAYSARLETAFADEEAQRLAAEAAQVREEGQRRTAELAQVQEQRQRQIAEAAMLRARDALAQMEQVEYFNSALVAQAALADGRQPQAVKALATCKPELRAWEWYALQAACHVEHLSVGGITFAFSPTRAELAGVGDDGTIRIWDLTTGAELRKLAAGAIVRAVAYDADGRHLAAVGPGGLRVWPVGAADAGGDGWRADGNYFGVTFSPDGRHVAATGEDLHVFEVAGGRELWKAASRDFHVAFSGDGRRLVSAGQHNVRLFDSANGKQLWQAAGYYNGLALSPDGERVVACGPAGARQFAADGGKPRWHAPGRFRAIAYGPDGRRVAAAGVGIEVFDADNGRLGWRAGGTFDTIAFSPDGRHVAGGSAEGLRVFDAVSGRKLWMIGGTYDHRVAFSRDGRRVAAGGLHGIQVWVADGERALWQIAGNYHSASFAADGRRVALAGRQDVRLIDLDGGRTTWKAVGDYFAVASSPDGRWVAAGGLKGLRVQGAADGQDAWQAPANVFGVAFSPDSRWLAACGSAGIRVCAAEGGQQRWRSDGDYFNVKFSPDGRHVAVCGQNGVRLLDAEDGAERWQAKAFLSRVLFSADGRRVAVGGTGGVQVFETDGGRLVWQAKGDSRRLALSPDGQWVAASGQQGVRLYTADDGRERWHADGAYFDVSFTPDSRRVAAGGQWGVRVHEVAAGRVLWQTQGSAPFVLFSPDGHALLAGAVVVKCFGGRGDLAQLLQQRRQQIAARRLERHHAALRECDAAANRFAAEFHRQWLRSK